MSLAGDAIVTATTGPSIDAVANKLAPSRNVDDRCARREAPMRGRRRGVLAADWVAEVVALPDLRSEVPEDRVRNRDVEEEVG